MEPDTLEKKKTAKLFKNGSSQAVRLPKEYRFEGDRVYIRKEGDKVILSPCQDPWKAFFESLEMFSEDLFAEGRQQPQPQERPELDDLFA